MGSSTQTALLGLPQFADDDRPTWRGDINGAMSKIDASYSTFTGELNGKEDKASLPTDIDSHLYQTTIKSGTSIAELQSIVSSMPDGGLVDIPPTVKLDLTGTLKIDKRITLTGGGTLSFSAGVDAAPGVLVAVPGVRVSNLTIDNPNMLSTKTTGNGATRSYGILVNASEVVVTANKISNWQTGVGVASGSAQQDMPQSGELGNITISLNRIIDIQGAGGGPTDPAAQQGNGEDRGDGIVSWGAQVSIVGNIVSAAAGTDARVGIHCEGLPASHLATGGVSHPDSMATIIGNVVYGQFRRGITTEDVSCTSITGNTVADATWFGINVTGGNSGSSTVSGNTILWTRTSADLQGASWNPTRSAIQIYQGATGVVVTGNTIRIAATAAADAAITVLATTTTASNSILVTGNMVHCLGSCRYFVSSSVNVANLSIVDNHSIGCDGGVYAYGIANLKITGNTIKGTNAASSYGVTVQSNPTNSLVTVDGSNMIDSFATGISIINSTSGLVTVGSNTISNCTTGIDLYGTTLACLKLNQFYNVATQTKNVGGGIARYDAPISSRALPPAYIGQLCIGAGVVYVGTGVSSVNDWTQVSN